jgi:hypothetical protein
VAQRGLGDGRASMDTCRALFGAIVTSTVGLAKSMPKPCLKVGWWKIVAATSIVRTLVRYENLPDRFVPPASCWAVGWGL